MGISKQELESRAYIFIYFGFGDWFNSYSGIDKRVGGFRKMVGLLKKVLVRDYGMDASRITIAYGGGRENPTDGTGDCPARRSES